ncbi:hypothetical protein IWW36_001028 [Coemansia brasiliensis]|uniref:Uncharacterized protein n=1 Tax=Coemansia brasiliensis TaxID=2650707 RepID=A0A9W8ICD2_9FUNG|nr:hypothetical protein IWW36_001028 [Coemansia brasiliensis]
MSNTTISLNVMHGVLVQLPSMSGKIVDDTRHEKVLSYLRLFLTQKDAVKQLLGWDIIKIVEQCLDAASDFRVSSVAIRFVGDALNAHDGELLWAELSHSSVLTWISKAGDSPHALVRVSALYFLRQASLSCYDEQFTKLLENADYSRLLLRRLQDSSYFVVSEACLLLAQLFSITQVDDELADLVTRIAHWQPEKISDKRKISALAVVSTLALEGNRKASEFAFQVFRVEQLEPYLFERDTIVRDKALDLLELMLSRINVEDVDKILYLLSSRLEYDDSNSRHIVVVLRCLAAVVKQLPENKKLDKKQSQGQCEQIANMAMHIIMRIYSNTPTPATSNGSSSLSILKTIEAQIFAHLNSKHSVGELRLLASEAARIVREHCRLYSNPSMSSAINGLLRNNQVQQHTQLLHLLLDATERQLRVSLDARPTYWQKTLSELVGNFAIHASRLKQLFNVVLEMPQGISPSLEQAIRARLADVEWEARDTALEFIAQAAYQLIDTQVQMVVTTAVADDVVGLLGDREEYVRASAASALAALLKSNHLDAMHGWIANHKSLQSSAITCLLEDGEAIVRRASLDLVQALMSVESSSNSKEWLLGLNHRLLYVLADDPDFEVRVRCVHLLTQLTLYSLHCLDAERRVIDELQSDALVLDMCRDSSRYVRQACLQGLTVLRKEIMPLGDKQMDEGEQGASKRVQQDENQMSGLQLLSEKLRKVDFTRLEKSLSAEHLYEEALDTQVERELMKESHERNDGNNILDCY